MAAITKGAIPNFHKAFTQLHLGQLLALVKCISRDRHDGGINTSTDDILWDTVSTASVPLSLCFVLPTKVLFPYLIWETPLQALVSLCRFHSLDVSASISFYFLSRHAINCGMVRVGESQWCLVSCRLCYRATADRIVT
jgi:hypothetical protein